MKMSDAIARELTLNNTLEFDEETHRYECAGRTRRSVTQVLKIAGILDSKWYTAGSRERGCDVHKACELFDLGNLDVSSVNDEHMGYLEGWIKFKDDLKFEPFLVEQRMAHPVLMVAGTCDRIGVIDGKPEFIVLDIKTGRVESWVALQLAAYSMMFEFALRKVMGEEKYPAIKRLAVQLKKDGTYKLSEFSDPDDKAYFSSALTVAKWLVKQGRSK